MVCIKTSSTIHDQEKEVPKLKYFVDVLKSDGCRTAKGGALLKEHTLTAINRLYSAVYNCENETALHTALKQVKAVISVVEAICSNPLQHIMPKKGDIAPNAKSERQLRFFKTSHRKKPNISLPKPSYDEVQHSQHRLETIEAKFCAVCFSEEDEHGDSRPVAMGGSTGSADPPSFRVRSG